MKRRLLFGVALCAITAPVLFGGVPIGLPAQEPTQILNGIKLLESITKQAQMVSNEMTQIEWMVYNSKNLGSHPFTAIQSDLMALNGVINSASGLAYGLGQIDQQFARMYPQYNPSTNWMDSYSAWSANTLKTINGSLGAAGLQGQQLQTEGAVMQQLRLMAQTPMGQTQAIQLGTQVSTEVVSQLQKLRLLLIADAQEKAAYQGLAIRKDEAKTQAQTQAFNANTWTATNQGW